MRRQATSSRNQQFGVNPFLLGQGHTLDTSPAQQETRQEVLRDAIFPNWKDDAGGASLGQPDEMAKQDPIGIQMWKLYSRTKAQLPNQERMDNLTWRMMAMNLKRKEREQQARYVSIACSDLSGKDFG